MLLNFFQNVPAGSLWLNSYYSDSDNLILQFYSIEQVSILQIWLKHEFSQIIDVSKPRLMRFEK